MENLKVFTYNVDMSVDFELTEEQKERIIVGFKKVVEQILKRSTVIERPALYCTKKVAKNWLCM